MNKIIKTTGKHELTFSYVRLVISKINEFFFSALISTSFRGLMPI